MKRIMCFFGFHDWYRIIECGDDPRVYACNNCGIGRFETK